MTTLPARGGSPVVPCLRYRNAPAAIEWLCRVFGFERHVIAEGNNGTIAHAELRLGQGLIMLGSATNEGEWSKFVKQPDELGGFETQACYLVVPNADVIYARVKGEGAAIEIEIQDRPYGGRDFTCRDLEGRLWSIGTYDPWKSAS